jgi:hypothetical protein
MYSADAPSRRQIFEHPNAYVRDGMYYYKSSKQAKWHHYYYYNYNCY